MKNAILSLALAATIALAGCAGFFVSQNPCTGSNCGGGGSTTSGYFYVLNNQNSGSNQLAGFQVATGKISALTDGSVNLQNVLCLAISPNNKYLYVGTGAGVYYFSISSAGALTAGNSGAPISV